jgi:TolB-like protein/Tfp pilus assembly protein PilF
VKDADPAPVPIRFGTFELDPESGELRKQGLKVRLQEQPFQILQILLENPGKVVTREELQQRIWPSDTFVDFDHGVYNAIQKLREALGDSADTPRYIETLSRRGYRFIAPLIAPVTGPAPEPRSSAPAAAESRDSIAVLPFLNLSPDPENEFFADGMSEEIINALAQIEQLHVVARSSAFSFKGKHIDLRIIGEQLNVRTILEGSVRRAGNHLRITAQLVKVADGYHLWSERYDREMKDIFEVQDEIARSIAERLMVSLEGKREGPLVRAATKNLEAYQLYLKGRAMLYQRGAAMLRAAKCFERAVALDPDYALAWAGLADAHTVLGYYGLVPPAASMPKGTEAARRAVALDPSLAEAHGAFAMCCLLHDWDLAAAEREFRCALKLNPRYIQAHCWYALFYLQLAVGRATEGIEHARLAVESDPLSGYANSMLGMTYSAAGKYAEAVEASERAVELDPDSFLARCSLQWALRFSRRFEDAVAACNSALAISGRHPWALSSLAMIFADWGKPADAESVYAEMMARARREYVAPAELAIAATAVGMQDEAIGHAREAFEIRDPFCRIQFSKYWPDSARLREDPRFQEILLKFRLD